MVGARALGDGGGREGEGRAGRRKSLGPWHYGLNAYVGLPPSPAPHKFSMWNSTLRVVIRRCGAFGR